MTNYYGILGVSPQSRPEEIKSAYRKRVRDAHPDYGGDSEHFRLIQQAHETLSDPKQRADYDLMHRHWMRQIGAVECHHCGHANRITRRPTDREIVRCWHCKTPLRLAWADFYQAQRQALSHEAARLVDEIGVDLADLVADAARSGIDRLRAHFGLNPKAKA